MQHLDLEVIEQALAWAHECEAMWLCTVLATFGSSPLEPGAWLVAQSDVATQHLIQILPTTIDMRDHLRQEKTGRLPSPLPA